MTSKRTPNTPSPDTARLKIARAEISAALHSSLTDAVMSHEEAARVLGVDKRTVGAWARRERPVNVEVVLAAPRLALSFRRALCTEHHAPVGYIAKKRRR